MIPSRRTSNEGNRLTKARISSALADDYLTEYVWDHRNRLTSVAVKNNTGVKKQEVLYTYDYLNRMVQRTANGQSEFYVHDGWQIVFQMKNNAVSQRYLWGANVDELIAQETVSPNATSWMLCDHLGSVRDVVSSTGTVLNHLEYNAFGLVTKQTSASNVPTFQYTGKMKDASTALQWNINRWYDAGVGRWISEDPIGFGGNDVNLYRYVGNNCVNYMDMNGKEKTYYADTYYFMRLDTFLGTYKDYWTFPPEGQIVYDYYMISEGWSAIINFRTRCNSEGKLVESVHKFDIEAWLEGVQSSYTKFIRPGILGTSENITKHPTEYYNQQSDHWTEAIFREYEIGYTPNNDCFEYYLGFNAEALEPSPSELIFSPSISLSWGPLGIGLDASIQAPQKFKAAPKKTAKFSAYIKICCGCRGYSIDMYAKDRYEKGWHETRARELEDQHQTFVTTREY